MIAYHWIAGRRNGVPLSGLMRTLTMPTCRITASRYISGVEEHGEYFRIGLTCAVEPLMYPRRLPMHELYQTIAETCDPTDWHRYETGKTVVTADDVVLDCGAAEGLFTLIASQKCAKVYAVDPNPTFVDAMTRTFERVPNVEVVGAGLSEMDGSGHLIDEGIASAISTSGTGVPINMRSIDSLFGDAKITYLKADVEGHEMDMLRGARRMIKTNRPKIAITTYHRPGDSVAIARFLKEIVPEYRMLTKGIDISGEPIMLHAWVE